MSLLIDFIHAAGPRPLRLSLEQTLWDDRFAAYCGVMGVGLGEARAILDERFNPAEPPELPEPCVSRTALADAYIAFGEATSLHRQVLAKDLGVSIGTFAGYINTGKAAKCSKAQAARMAEECEWRIESLQRALDVFNKVKES